MHLLSIIVPVYNVASQLVRCIETICNQTYRNIEIILVDDGSTDESGQICDDFSAKDDRIKVIHKTNGGLSSARNAGLDAATGYYYGFVDSDDYIELDMYEILVSCLENNPRADIACAGIIREGQQGENKEVIRCPHTETIYDWKEAITEILRLRNIGISVWSKLFKKNVFENVRFPEGQTNEDANIVMDLHRNRMVVHSARPLYHYVVREGSITSKYDPKRALYTWKNIEKIQQSLSGESVDLRKQAKYYEAICMYNTLISYNCQNDVKDEKIAVYFDSFKSNCIRLILSNECTMRMKVNCILLRFRIYRILRWIIKRRKS